MNPFVRAATDDAGSLDDPSESQLLELMDRVARGIARFVILERTADPTGQTYIQAIANEDGSWHVEHRAGSAERHFASRCDDVREAHRLLTAWVSGRPGWEDAAPWSRMTL